MILCLSLEEKGMEDIFTCFSKASTCIMLMHEGEIWDMFQRFQMASSERLIASNPRLATVRRLRIVFQTAFLGICGGLTWGIINTQTSIIFWQALGIELILAFVLFSLATLAYFIEVYWKRIEKLRLYAISEKNRDEQFQSISMEFSLPLIFATSTSWFARLAIGLCGIVCLGIVLFLISSPPFIIAFYGFLSTIGLLICVYKRPQKCEVIVTSEGIASRTREWSYEHVVRVVAVSIPWHEASLFICYPAWGSRRTGARTIYELSSATQIVRWTSVHHKSRWWSFMEEPVGSLNEYNAKVLELYDVVKAKTGLQLYDFNQLL